MNTYGVMASEPIMARNLFIFNPKLRVKIVKKIHKSDLVKFLKHYLFLVLGQDAYK